MINRNLPLRGPVYAHDCGACVFLGHYEGHDLYFCPRDVVDGGTVIARWDGEPSHYASGLPFGRIPLTNSTGLRTKFLRVACLIAADLGYAPFTEGATLMENGDLIPKAVTVGYVLSESDNTKRYTIIQMPSGEWECNCKAFFHSDRSSPCKHIVKMRSLKRVKPGQLTLKSVTLTKKGEPILRAWRRENGLSEVKP